MTDQERRRDYFRRIGQLGYRAQAERLGPEGMAAKAAAGGRALLERYGVDHYRVIVAKRRDRGAL